MDAFDLAVAGQSEQGSQNWFDIRAGRFTASEIFRLMKPGERLMTDAELAARPKTGSGSKTKWIQDDSVLATDAETYVHQKVAETLTGECPERVFSYATRHGEEWEPYAVEYFCQKYGYEYEVVAFVPVGDHFGGSPDRYVRPVGADLYNEGLEIKCPYNAANQVQYLMLSDQWDLKRMFPDYYWQVMANLLFTGKDRWNFVTFDSRFKEDKFKMSRIIVEPHKGEFDKIATKLEAAVKMKLEWLKTLRSI